MAAPLAAASGVPILTPWSLDTELTKDQFPGLFQLQPNARLLAQAVRDMVFHYRWRLASFLHADSTFGSALAWSIEELLSAQDIRVNPSTSHRWTSVAETKIALEGVKASNCTIIIVTASTSQLQLIFQAAHDLGMLVEGYAWIVAPLSGDVRLLPAYLQRLMYGSLVIQPSIDTTSYLNFTADMRKEAADPSLFPIDVPASPASLYAYDAVSGLAAALDRFYNQTNGCHSISDSAAKPVLGTANTGIVALPNLSHGKQLFGVLRSVKFQGQSGPVAFSQETKQKRYDIIYWNEGGNRVVATWTEEGSLSFPTSLSVNWTGGTAKTPSGRFGHGILRVLVPISAPFSFLKENASQYINSSALVIDTIPNNLFQGVAIDMFRLVAKREGFDYKLMLWQSPSWDNMVALVGNASSPYDIGVSSVTVTKKRSTQCNFSRSFYLSGLLMLVRRPTEASANLWVSFGGLDWRIWLLLFFCFLGVAVFFLVVDPEAVRQRTNSRIPLADSVFFAFSTFFFVHDGDRVRNPWAKAFLITLLFVILIIVAAYTANMVFILSNRKGTAALSEFNDLPGVWVGSRRGGTNWPYVTGELGLRKVKEVAGAEDAVKALRNYTVDAYIADIPHLKKIAANNCDLKVAGRRVSIFMSGK